MTKQLPTRPDLDVLKREAKTLLKSDQTLANLAEAQHRLAQSYGFDKWADLKHRIEEINLAWLSPANWLKRTDYPQTIPPHPNPKNDWWLALANADSQLIASFLEKDPTLANTPGGPLDRYPLHYAACLYVQGIDTQRTVQALLKNGANPNVAYHESLTPLWGAIQVKQDPELAKLLLENGADPNDNESMYHCMEIDEPGLLKLLLEKGARVESTNCFARALDFERIAQVQILLDHGANPNTTLGRENMLCHAIRRNRSSQIIKLLLDNGVDPNVKSNEGLTPFQLACQKSPWDVIELLKDCCPAQYDDDAYALAAIRHGKSDRHPANLTPAQLAVLPHDAFNRNVASVKNLLAAGWPVDAPDDGHVSGSHGATALHHACFAGFPEVVDLLIKHGANLEIVERAYNSTPLGWAMFGSVHSQIPGGNHLECVRLLIAAGVEKPKIVNVASDDVRDLLAEHHYLPD